MKPIIHHTTKYDGSIHYRYSAGIVAQTDTALALYRGVDVELQSYRGDFDSDTHVLQFFFAEAHHNVAIIWERDWSPKMHYVNIATPATWYAGRLSAIDLDLDLIISASSEEVIIDDEEEFDAHIDRFAYPKDLIHTCRNETERLHSIMSERIGLFGMSVFGWRPGDCLDRDFLVAL